MNVVEKREGRVMKKRIFIALTLVAVMSAAPTTVFATPTPSPQSPQSPQPSPSSTHPKQVLTQAQKDVISAARSAFAAAKANAQNGFARAIADAQAIRDQAIGAAGTSPNAIRAAKKDFRDSYKTIFRAYTTNLNNAKLIFQRALAALNAAKKS